jgi:hypothetical protein
VEEAALKQVCQVKQSTPELPRWLGILLMPKLRCSGCDGPLVPSKGCSMLTKAQCKATHADGLRFMWVERAGWLLGSQHMHGENGADGSGHLCAWRSSAWLAPAQPASAVAAAAPFSANMLNLRSMQV